MSSRHCPPMRCSQIHSHALQLRDAAEQERPIRFHLDPFLFDSFDILGISAHSLDHTGRLFPVHRKQSFPLLDLFHVPRASFQCLHCVK